ncbi:hypothetical protein LXL04_016548 [Taraxacum kok-saghyz]
MVSDPLSFPCLLRPVASIRLIPSAVFFHVVVISVRRLRPPPPTVLARFHLGDMVDAWHNEGWWVGRYVRREGQKYTVFFENEAPANQHVSYPKSQIRVHQEWKELEEGGKWKYVKR